MAAVTDLPKSGRLIIANPYRAQEAAKLGAKLGLDHMLSPIAPRDTLYQLDLDTLLPRPDDWGPIGV